MAKLTIILFFSEERMEQERRDREIALTLANGEQGAVEEAAPAARYVKKFFLFVKQKLLSSMCQCKLWLSNERKKNKFWGEK